MENRTCCLFGLIMLAAFGGCHHAEPRESRGMSLQDAFASQMGSSWIDVARNIVVKHANGRVEMERVTDSSLPPAFKGIRLTIATHEVRVTKATTLDYTLDGQPLWSEVTWTSSTQPSEILFFGPMFDSIVEECLARIPVAVLPDVLEFASLRPDAPVAIETVAAELCKNSEVAFEMEFADGTSRVGTFELSAGAIEKLDRIVRHETPTEPRRSELERGNWINNIEFDYPPRPTDAKKTDDDPVTVEKASGHLNVTPSPPSPATLPLGLPASRPLRND